MPDFEVTSTADTVHFYHKHCNQAGEIDSFHQVSMAVKLKMEIR